MARVTSENLVREHHAPVGALRRIEPIFSKLFSAAQGAPRRDPEWTGEIRDAFRPIAAGSRRPGVRKLIQRVFLKT